MQRHQILINKSLNLNELAEQSGLVFKNNYFVYSQSLGGGLTNEFNVRAYLNDTQNQVIIDQFISFIRQGTSEAEFLEIFYDDSKLYKVFNAFFESELQGQQVSVTAKIDESLQNTISVIIVDNNFKWLGNTDSSFMIGSPSSILNQNRINTSKEELVNITNENSYYIDVNLNLTSNHLPREKFKICNNFIDARLSPLEFALASQGIIGIEAERAVSDFMNSANSQNPSSSIISRVN